MKYTLTMVIDRPVEMVAALYDDPSNLPKWQPNIVSYTPVSGISGQQGSKAQLTFQMQEDKVNVLETIISRNLPTEITGSYQTKGVKNLVKNTFKATPDNGTLWTVESMFVFSGIKKLLSLFMKGDFKQQTNVLMTRFKQFAESQR